MSYKPATPPSTLTPALQQYLTQELNRIAVDLAQVEGGGPGPEPGEVRWGDITGDIDNQLDLRAEQDVQDAGIVANSDSIIDLNQRNNNAGLVPIAMIHVRADGTRENRDYVSGKVINSSKGAGTGFYNVTLSGVSNPATNTYVQLSSGTLLVAGGLWSGSTLAVAIWNAATGAYQDFEFWCTIWEEGYRL